MAVDDLFTALALCLVIEGVVYALFPAAMQRLIAQVLEQPEGALRVAGVTATVVGVGIVWLLRG